MITEKLDSKREPSREEYIEDKEEKQLSLEKSRVIQIKKHS